MKVSAGFRAFVLGQLEELGDIVPRAMFGGVGLYCNGVFFGLIADDTLYLRADNENRPAFESAGAQPFTPFPGRSRSMRYYSVPIGVLESGVDVTDWARKALAAARRESKD